MDAHARLLVWELIDALRRDGVTVLLTTTNSRRRRARRPDRHHRPWCGGGRGTPAELMRTGAKDQLRFSAPPRLDLSLLVAALPEDYKTTEVTRGEYLVEDRSTPGAGDCDRMVRADRRAPHGHAGEQRSLEDVFLDLTAGSCADDR
ncbi:hypothetical protein I552_0034 [Mycobacterium xenopi 3993]|nr:hypothetical protein I552_0034 [Mycobacterium xenopi 3993]